MAVLVPVVLATVTWSYVLDYDSWRLDLMQAADRAGLYLFLVSPCYAAVSAWAVVRAREGIGDVAHGLPAPALIWRRCWPPYAVFGLAVHVLVLALMIGTALFSDPVGAVAMLPIVVQLLSIPFFAALGALCGGLWKSRLAAPVVLLTLLLLNTLLIQYGFRRVSEVGTGSGDFIDLALRTGYLLPKAALYAALGVFAWPARFWAMGRIRLARAATAVVSVCCFLYVFTTDGQAQVYRPSRPACHQTNGIRICVPQDLRSHARDFDGPVNRAMRLVTSLGVTDVPRQIDVVSRGATALRRGAVTVTATAVDAHHAWNLQRAVDFGFGYAQACDDPTSAVGVPDRLIVTRALLDGWLQHQTGTVQPGSFPEQDLDALLKLPRAQRVATLRYLFTAVWKCDRNVQPFGTGA